MRERPANRTRRIQYRLRDRDGEDRSNPMFAARHLRQETADRARGLICGGIGAMHLLVRRAGMVEIADNLENKAWKHLRRKPKYTLKTEPRWRR
jgi:hypothetical protein